MLAAVKDFIAFFMPILGLGKRNFKIILVKAHKGHQGGGCRGLEDPGSARFHAGFGVLKEDSEKYNPGYKTAKFSFGGGFGCI
jgi:hypothetical protein